MTTQYTVCRAFSRPEPGGVKTYEVGALVTFDTPEQATYHVDAEFVVEGAPLALAAAPVADKPTGKPARARKPKAAADPDPDSDLDADLDADDDE